MKKNYEAKSQQQLAIILRNKTQKKWNQNKMKTKTESVAKWYKGTE